MRREKIGKVYLVGAGPGDGELITVKGLRCIKEADTLVYDYLANDILLKEAKMGAEIIYVGKKKGKHTFEQEEINKLLLKLVSKGKIVARLKGGDPFIFGRGSEEALYLKKNGIPFEIVPGITSALGVPAYAGIPITHRGLSSTLTVVTGHEDPKKGFSQVKWDRIASGFDTLIILMGMKNFSYIIKNLIKNGLSPEKDIAVIQWGSTPLQKTVVGKLKDIGDLAKKKGISSPSVIVIGDVVKLRNKLNWFESRPLFGKRILITRPEEQACELSNLLTIKGAEVIELPLIKITRPYTWKFVDEAIKNLESYDWIVFTSANGVRYFFQRFFRIAGDIRNFGKIKICAIGSATEKIIRDFHLNVDVKPKKFTSQSLIEEFSKKKRLKNKRFLLPRANIAGEFLSDELKKLGALVDDLVVYRTILEKEYKSEYIKMLKDNRIDLVTFTSSSTVMGFIRMAGKYKILNILPELKVVSIGPETTKTAREYGFNIEAEAKVHDIYGLFDAIMNLCN